MNTANHFAPAPEIRQCTVRGKVIKLYINEKIFPPSPHGLLLAYHIHINRADKVIDIGTGSGVLAIAAAQRGAFVCATDTDPEAVRIAEYNTRHNNTKALFSCGEFFAEFNTAPFDVIIANLPQEITPPNYKTQVGDSLFKTISGGPAGNEILLNFLGRAPRFMHAASRLYIIVATLTDYQTTLAFIAQHFRARLLAFSRAPAKSFVLENEDWYAGLLRQGKIFMTKIKGQWHVDEYIFELRLK